MANYVPDTALSPSQVAPGLILIVLLFEVDIFSSKYPPL